MRRQTVQFLGLALERRDVILSLRFDLIHQRPDRLLRSVEVRDVVRQEMNFRRDLAEQPTLVKNLILHFVELHQVDAVGELFGHVAGDAGFTHLDVTHQLIDVQAQLALRIGGKPQQCGCVVHLEARDDLFRFRDLLWRQLDEIDEVALLLHAFGHHRRQQCRIEGGHRDGCRCNGSRGCGPLLRVVVLSSHGFSFLLGLGLVGFRSVFRRHTNRRGTRRPSPV